MFKSRVNEAKLAPHDGVVTVGLMSTIRDALLVTMVLLGVLCCWCGSANAEKPTLRKTYEAEIPYLQVEEFLPTAEHVNVEFYAFLIDTLNPKPTTVSLQYADAENYRPDAATPSERYAMGTTVVVAESAETEPELHAHVVLERGKVYHYRLVAENTDGSFETPDEVVQTDQPSLGELPDGRAYEQVTPPNKNNVDALGIGQAMTMQASPAGSRFAFFSFEPFPVAVGSARWGTDYLSSRSSSPAWSTQGVQAPTEPIGEHGELDEVVGFTEDLERTIVQVYGRLVQNGRQLGSVGVTNAYVRNNTTGEYQILASDVGAEPVLFADAASDDSRILFETTQQLLPAAAAGVSNLYEWDEGKPEGERVSLAGVLPEAECVALGKPRGCAPANGSGAGPGGGEKLSTEHQDYLQDTFSSSGSKIFFTAHPSGRVYEREPQAELTIPVSLGAATFLSATPSGHDVFYSEGNELYRFDSESETSEALTSGAEGIAGSLGISDDGTYAYFVAHGVLAADENANEEHAETGALNLYEWHEDPVTGTDQIVFIARLEPGSERGVPEGDATDWTAADAGSAEGKTSRVTPDGRTLLFMSHSPLTGYDNGQCKRKGTPCQEYFLYSAGESLSAANPVCVSCNPSGIAATAPARLGQGELEVALKGPEWSPHLTRNLSDDGDRVFFETEESLVPSDTNGVSDVYEWERGGVGSCPASQAHCLYLISTGTAHAKSFFGDADATGENVFFFTRQPLVGQDNDLNFDVYDARVGGGIPAQNPSVDRCEGEGCRPDLSVSQVFGAPGSVVLTGVGNLAPSSPVVSVMPKKAKCVKGRRLSHGKCVKAKGKPRSKGKRKAKIKKDPRSRRGGR